MATIAEDRAQYGEVGALVTSSLHDPPADLASVQLGWRNWSNVVAYALNLIVTYTSLTGAFGATNADLSKKYQTLVTPAGWAFSIWGPIFIGEGVFAVAQLFPRFRGTAAVQAVTPWWSTACVFQVAWTLFFAQELITMALVCMLGILVCLLGVAASTDGLEIKGVEYVLLRAPFSLHLGWIIVASAVNASVHADAALASPEVLLGLAVASYAVVIEIATVFASAVKSADPIVCFVVAWAFAAIHAELGSPQDLDDPDRFNPQTWDRITLGGLRNAALSVTVLALGLAVLAIARIAVAARRSSDDAVM